MIGFTFISDYIRVGPNWTVFEHVGDLSQILLFMFRYENERHTSESVDEREEEIVDEEMVVTGTEIVESCHEFN